MPDQNTYRHAGIIGLITDLINWILDLFPLQLRNFVVDVFKMGEIGDIYKEI